MRTTITIDDALYDEAVRVTGEDSCSVLVAKALQTLVTVEASKRLIALSGKAPEFSVAPRSKRAVAEKHKPYGRR